MNKFRTNCGTLLDYDWISIPLVYTQVVTLAVYSYFLTTLISRQTLEVREERVVDSIFPFFTILEYFFYVGWLKVAESLINPFGEDDDDFEVCWLVDRNVQMCFIIVDRVHNNLPPLKKDMYWGKIAPASLPYTAAAKKFMMEYPQPSTRNIVIKEKDRKLQDVSSYFEIKIIQILMCYFFRILKKSESFVDDILLYLGDLRAIIQQPQLIWKRVLKYLSIETPILLSRRYVINLNPIII